MKPSCWGGCCKVCRRVASPCTTSWASWSSTCGGQATATPWRRPWRPKAPVPSRLPRRRRRRLRRLRPALRAMRTARGAGCWKGK
ncbi:unnamed protein product [Effrenium voratum]|uniref:Uncharacterized protein n=1 Tax=Effrenium voratum TaxID=2562239 RepID=A0AA36J4L1_9DINO|nr:unnamed protein product [Effrenium voratum]